MYLQDAENIAPRARAYDSDMQLEKAENMDVLSCVDQNDRETDEAEDTEDASETDVARQEEDLSELQEQRYQERLASYRQELQQIQDLTHPGYQSRLKKIEQAYHDRCVLNEVIKQVEIELIEREYNQEKRFAVRELEEKTEELRESLIQDLEEKRRMVEGERNAIDLTGDTLEVKSVTTRKLRRRPNDPTPQLPCSEKRRKTSPTQLNLLLDEHEINEDLKQLHRGKLNPLSRRDYGDDVLMFEGSAMFDARIEDGKLFYDKKWYHRGQSVHVESPEHGRFVGVIANFAQFEFYVKRNQDGCKVKIPISYLQRGKYIIRRKSP